jgi:mono/diheme cytochrome c family protein
VQVQDLGSPLDGMLRTFPAELDRVLAAERPGNGRPDQRQLRNGASYVGADTCARCHAEAATAWRNSAHARPFSAYAPGKEDLSTPSCMTCHTSGAFEQGGWTGPEDTSDLGSVSCESCHGPGSLHAADPKPGYGAMPRQACGGCHTPDRSSRLDAETVWKAAGHAFK